MQSTPRNHTKSNILCAYLTTFITVTTRIIQSFSFDLSRRMESLICNHRSILSLYTKLTNEKLNPSLNSSHYVFIN